MNKFLLLLTVGSSATCAQASEVVPPQCQQNIELTGREQLAALRSRANETIDNYGISLALDQSCTLELNANERMRDTSGLHFRELDQNHYIITHNNRAPGVFYIAYQTPIEGSIGKAIIVIDPQDRGFDDDE